jgi:prepilin-type N-terminal cleavage/methylation domain-containing protein/prepilin-type processing-associated H-X9-DG protein
MRSLADRALSDGFASRSFGADEREMSMKYDKSNPWFKAMPRRAAFTLLELVVVIAIIVTLLGLVSSAAMQARQAAQRVKCLNNVKQINMAVQNFAVKNGRLPRGDVDTASGFPLDSMFFNLLPYIEHGNYYAAVQLGQRPRGSDYTVNVYICPADPTVRYGDGCASYAANAAVFMGRVQSWSSGPNGQVARVSFGTPSFDYTFPDGTSNTIAFAEHYADPPGKPRFDWFTSIPILGASEFMRRASFADKEYGDVVPVTTNGSTIPSVSGLTFQVRPPVAQVDPRIPQTPHSGGMPVGMADGSARILRPTLSERTFWALVTPAGGEVIQGDW